MRLIILAFLVYVLYRLWKKTELKDKDIGEMVQDPVCKIYIPANQAYQRRIGGNRYFFCSKRCADIFEKKLKEGQK